ncbi:MAG: hypothetical protein R6T85_07180 [Egibacteraceae bacterium]
MERQPLAAWLDAGDAPLDDEPEEEPSPRRRRARLLLLAALPWAVLGGVLVGARDGGSAEEGAEASPGSAEQAGARDDGAGATDATDATDDEAGRTDDDATDATDDDAGRTGADTARDDEPGATVPPAAGAGAVVAVREAATASAGDEARRYVDLAVAEAAEAHGDVTVVRVLAVVLEGDARAWTDAAIERYAVAVAPDGRALSAPWRVPDPPAAGDEPAWHPVDDDEALAAARDALERHGAEPGGDLAVDRAEAAPGLLRATWRDAEVWLADADPPRVLGAPTSTSDDEETSR